MTKLGSRPARCVYRGRSRTNEHKRSALSLWDRVFDEEAVLLTQIIQQFGRLDAAPGRKVLGFARRLSLPLGTPGRELLSFAGAVDDRDLDAISEAIQEGC